jgi:hypothetical protein
MESQVGRRPVKTTLAFLACGANIGIVGSRKLPRITKPWRDFLFLLSFVAKTIAAPVLRYRKRRQIKSG